ncbi:MAG: hypothetical protein P4N59_16495 [Negativicutes bacterium]|nr:hypothetical protein [Negativicutes bacterium]
MGREWKASNSYTLSSTQVEKLLSDAYGDKLRPVNDAQMARQRRNQAMQEERREKAQDDANNPIPEDPTSDTHPVHDDQITP